MKELLLVGRGGEGVVLASQVLADALARAGFQVQSFPEFKAERRGAPISAFLRWDDRPIHRRWKLRECDVLVDVTPSDPTPQTLAAVRPGGLIVLNRDVRFRQAGPFEIARTPASRLAQERGVLSSEGRPMGNVAMLGACVRLLLPEGLAFLEQAIAARFGVAAQRNVLAARDGYERCTRQHAVAGDQALEVAPAAAKRHVAARFPVSTTDSRGVRTGSWSLDRPVILDACNACAVCALFCPEGAITRDGGELSIDYLYCKGCGICEQVCPVRNAIEMEAVPA